MESAALTIPLSTISKTLKLSPNPIFHRHFSKTAPNPTLQTRFSSICSRTRCFSPADLHKSREWFLISFAGMLFQNPSSTAPISSRLAHISSSASARAFGSGGGGDGVGGGSGGGGGDGGSNGGGSEARSVGGEADAVSAGSPDVIILDVGGMTCGGCAASVKRILESQVSSASVNLTTETAVVWATPEVKGMENWQQQLGEKLAKHLTSCGFNSNLRDSEKQSLYRVFEKKMDEKLNRLKKSGRELAVSWALCAVCLLGHVCHFFGANAPSWIHTFHSTAFHLSLSLLTLVGPGRRLILDGLKSLLRGSPNMNTLVGLGAISSFAVSSIAALVPKLGWKAFFEEPIMLIAFVLLGRNLEQRAKLKATSDMTGLMSILPTKARLMVDNNMQGMPSIVEVPCNSLSVGDQIVVLPGDRIPADGVVKSGRSTVDESSFTGEPLPITKLPGADVTAGSINLNGTLTVEVRRPGGETLMGDIIRLVEEAQSRGAPVQRLADKVAGHFTYGVMTLSAATFLFWNAFGSKILPLAFQQGSPVSLALQLSCSVLVVACPCALGLATPTAVLVGTSLGATKGLLLRGGDILEKFALADTIVFDKTGTLTAGKPIVTKVVTFGCDDEKHLKQRSNDAWSEVEVLRLAAGVEANTIHPVGKAIQEAARVAGFQNVKAMEGTFREEPGSGAIATVEQKRVSVGTLEWLQRHGVDENPSLEVEEFKNQSAVYVGVDGVLAGIIYFEDKIREDANRVVESLSKQGIDVYMLSGDKKHTAEYVASIVGIQKEKVISGVKPDEKKNFILELQKNHKVIAMVGDGINDTAALASSDVGIAMGGGVGAASEVSSIVLMGNRLSQVGIPIAAGLLLPMTGTMLTPSIAGALMGLSSMGVMANSMLLRIKFASKHRTVDKLPQYSKPDSGSDLFTDKNNGWEKPYPAKWRNS
ncbi:copper-transporting ATPase PAA1, chloroplastic [Cinnamomum micranthum f. kanehirae]|uniref:Copper-transporting ATPase PAA1, chloroplastic n=1 Tax=Cinnamomum micranthum f. kanehirae TaxID=337451 RepID=A0A443NIZ4_9MAGN|nr:copper-transporting ATPase PAA1, chloroplastic [Cinnamomum micranthum f. kanehirae]